MKKFELVIPAYNEEKNLKLLLDSVVSALNTLSISPQDFQLILVDNGSTDASAEALQQFQQQNPYKSFLKVHRVTENQGYGHGVWEGLKQTSAPIIGWTHADLQCDPAAALLAFQDMTIKPSNAFFKGHRQGRSLQERFVSHIFYLLAHAILKLPTPEINAQPKVFHRDLLQHLKNPPKDFSFDLYVLYVAFKKKYNFYSITVPFPPRQHGFSHWSSHFLTRYKTIYKMIKSILKFSNDSKKGQL